MSLDAPSYAWPSTVVDRGALPALRKRRVTLGHTPFWIHTPRSPQDIIERSIDDAVRAEAPAPEGSSFAGRYNVQHGASAGGFAAHRSVTDPTIPYWVDLWPAAVGLGRCLLRCRLGGVRTIELGGGVGLGGLAAARRGARVVITDNQPEALAVARLNAAANRLDVDTRLLDWYEPSWSESFGLVVAADVIYEEALIEPLAALFPDLLDERGVAVVADPGRSYVALFRRALAARGLHTRTHLTHFYWDGMNRSVTLIHASRDADLVGVRIDQRLGATPSRNAERT